MDRPRVATAVLLTRGEGEALELFLVLRAPELRFFGGYWAFPGGALDPLDVDEDDDEASDGARAAVRCGLRELFEETGVLPAEWAKGAGEDRRRDVRAGLLAGDAEAGRELRRWLDAAPAALDAVPVLGTLTTPAFAPIRYRTRFVHVRMPAGARADVWPGELVEGRFDGVHGWRASWRLGERLVAPPVLFMLDELARLGLAGFTREIPRALAALEAGRLHTIRNVPGIVMAPLATETLPPATTTNAYVAGERRIVVVDPAPEDPAELARLTDMLDERVASGDAVEAVLLTHHHRDHVGGARATAERYGVPVLAHEETLARLDLGGVAVRAIGEGDRIALGAAPDESEDWALEVHHTPGHSPGHLCFRDTRYGSLIAGDLVSTLSTIVIDPADGGDLAAYVASLARMSEARIGILHPAHGPVARDGAATLRRFIEHRAARERLLVAALGAAPRTPEDLFPDVYADVADARLAPLALRSLRAGLIKLEREGRAAEAHGAWTRVSGSDAR